MEEKTRFSVTKIYSIGLDLLQIF